MNRYLNSFLITTAIYIVIAFLLFFSFDDISIPDKHKENTRKISLNNINIIQESSQPKVESTPTQKPVEEVKPKPVIESVPKVVEEQKPIKKEPPKVTKPKELPKEAQELKKNIAKNFGDIKPPEKIGQKTKKELDINEAKQVQENILKETTTLQDKTLENFLSQKEPINKEILSELEKLYGAEYKTFTKVQKDYLEKNINNFQVITQRVLNRLGYPKLAAKLRIGGINTVEFLFHPNGDISDLRIITPSGYSILDEYSLELIKIAYKDYPKPKTTTKLRFRVFYNLY